MPAAGVGKEQLREGDAVIDENDHEALCEAVVRQTEIAGSECFEKNYVKDGDILASVFCFVGPHASEMTAMIREQLDHFGFRRDVEEKSVKSN